MGNRKHTTFINFMIWGPLFCLAMVSCKDKVQHKEVWVDASTPEQGTIRISVDETFKPIIGQQVKVYENTFPEAHIIASYKSEADCFKDMENDSIQMIVVARKLSNQESQYYDYKLGFRPPYEIMAWDAIAIVTNITNQDSLFSNDRLRQLLTSSQSTDPQIIVDGSNATSTVRYLNDSLLNGTAFGQNVVAANGNQDVLNYIAAHPAAVGIVGMGWIGEDGTDAKKFFDKNLKLALVRCKTCKENIYARPSQATIADMQYPYYRPLVAIVKDNALGLAKGFYNYMLSERGQLVFRQAMLMPNQLNLNVRTMNIRAKK